MPSYFEEDGQDPCESSKKLKMVWTSSQDGLKHFARNTANVLTRTLSDKKFENVQQLRPTTDKPSCFLAKKRWQIALMANLGFVVAFGIRCNFGAAKGRMVNNFTDPYGDIYEQEFYWTPTELGQLESSFFYGYAASQIPGGLLAAKIPPNRLFGCSVLIASILNIILAFSLKAHPITDALVIALQIAQGLSLGVSFPAMHGVWSKWAPPLERSKLATTTFTGCAFGVMLGMSVSAYLVAYVGWSAPFYVYGVVGIAWAFCWFKISAPSPASHSTIDEDEAKYIEENIGYNAIGHVQLCKVPWRRMLLSLPVWSIVICTFCKSWTFFLLLGNQLTYMSDVLGLQMHHGGLISAIPQVCNAVVELSAGQLVDYLRASGRMTTVGVRKTFTAIGFLGEATFLAVLAFVTMPMAAVPSLILAVGISGMSTPGYKVNHFDIAPRFASILMGLSNGLGALAGLGGFLTEHFTRGNPLLGWQKCFLLAMLIDLVGLAFYLIFASGELQDWAQPETATIESRRRSSVFTNRQRIYALDTNCSIDAPVIIDVEAFGKQLEPAEEKDEANNDSPAACQ